MRALLLLILLTLVGPPARAQADPPVTPTGLADASPAGVLALLKAAGYAAELRPNGPRTVISFRHQGALVSLEFLGCAPAGCRTLNASHGVDLPAGLEWGRVNDWNSDHFSLVYLDAENDPYIERAFELRGGFTGANLRSWLDAYLTDLQEFMAGLPK